MDDGKDMKPVKKKIPLIAMSKDFHLKDQA